MSAPLRLALIGAGAIGNAYAQASRIVDEVELTWVVDQRHDVADTISDALSTSAATDPFALAEPGVVDLVLVTTPPAAHEDICIAYLDAEIPVMCEKPLAPTLEGAERIRAAAARSGTLLTMASKFRFVSDVIQARGLVEAGALGEVIRADVSFASRVDMRHRWNSDPKVSGGGVLIDNGTHAVDILRYVVGPVDRVIAATTTSSDGLSVEDTATMLLSTWPGVASATVSWAMDLLSERYLAIFGTEGSMEVGWSSSRLRTTSTASDVVLGRGYDKLTALAGNLRNVARAVLGKEDLVVTPADAMASVAVVEAAYESARRGTWVDVVPPPPAA